MKNLGQSMGKTEGVLLSGLLSLILFTLIISTGTVLGATNYEAPSNKRASGVFPPNLRSDPHVKVYDRVAADLQLDVCYTVFVITGRSMTLPEHKTMGAALIGPYLTPHQIYKNG